jgi:hypothetical protein
MDGVRGQQVRHVGKSYVSRLRPRPAKAPWNKGRGAPCGASHEFVVGGSYTLPKPAAQRTNKIK